MSQPERDGKGQGRDDRGLSGAMDIGARGIIDDTIREFGASGGLKASDRQAFLGLLEPLRRD